MKNRPVMDSHYQKLIIYPSQIDPRKMNELMKMFSKMKIPLSYEQY